MDFGELRSLIQARPTPRRWARLRAGLETVALDRYHRELEQYLLANIQDRWPAAYLEAPSHWISALAPWLPLCQQVSITTSEQYTALAQALNAPTKPLRHLREITLNQRTSSEEHIWQWRGGPEPPPHTDALPTIQAPLTKATLRGVMPGWFNLYLPSVSHAPLLELEHCGLNARGSHIADALDDPHGLIEQLERRPAPSPRLSLKWGGTLEALGRWQRCHAQLFSVSWQLFPAAPITATAPLLGQQRWPLLPQLETLELSGALDDAMLMTLTSLSDELMPQVKTLKLRSPEVSATSLMPILQGHGWPSLTHLELHQVEGSALDLSRITRKLCGLSIRQSGMMRHHIKQLMSNTTLTDALSTLALERLPMSLHEAEQLISADWPKLKRLELIACNLTSKSISALFERPWTAQLEHLNLSSNPIKRLGMLALARAELPELRALYLYDAGITSGLIEAMMERPWFRSLELLSVSRLNEDNQRWLTEHPLSQDIKVLTLG